MGLFNYPLRGHGVWTETIPLGKKYINRHSVVFAHLCEVAQEPGGALDFPFVGDAGMKVNNIAPQDNGDVQFQIEIDWGHDLNVQIRGGWFTPGPNPGQLIP